MKIGFVGAGRVILHYLELYNNGSWPEMEIVGFHDLDSEISRKFEARSKIKSYKTLANLLEVVDGLIITTPSDQHFEPSKIAIEAGVPVLIEKPICLRLDEAYQLQNIAKKNNTYIGSVLQNRYNPAVKALSTQLSESSIGKIYSGSLRLRWYRNNDYYSDSWHGRWATDGGVVAQQAIHHISVADLLLGPIDEIYSKCFQLDHEMEAEDLAVGVFTMSDGFPLTFELTTCAGGRDFEASLSINSETGIWNLGGIALNTLTHFDSNNNVRVIAHQEVKNGYGYGHEEEVANFLLRSNQGFEDNSLNDSLRALNLVHSIYFSNENFGPVKVNNHQNSKKLGLGNYG